MLIQELIVNTISAAYLHDLSPFAIKFSADYGIRWYGLSYLAGFLAAYYMLSALSKKGLISLNKQQVSDFVFYVAVGVVLGGRLGYCLFYDPALFTKFNSSFPFWGALEVHKGGMASHGGILGIIVSCILFARKEKLIEIELFDLVALTGCLGIFFGRMANFVNAELPGRPCPDNYIFAVKFPQDLISLEEKDFPKLESVAKALGFSSQHFAQALSDSDRFFFNRLAEISLLQIQKGDQQIRQLVEPLLVARYPSQIYAGLLEGLAIFILLWILRLRFNKTGVASSGFLVAYPIMRVISEQFRLPDIQIGYQALGLTRGQWLSIGMLAIGLIYSYLVLHRKKDK